MNRIYKVIWSKVKHQYVVVSELAHSCTKSAGSRVGRSAAAVLAALVLTTGLCAAPVQAEDLTDPYAIVNARVKETNSTSSDTLVTLVQSPLAKSVAPLANEDEGQPGEGGDTTGTTPTEQPEQHTIYNEEGFYAHNQQNTYNALTKDGLWVGGNDQAVGFHVDNDGNLFTNGTATFKKGADMGGQKITNVDIGEALTDAVNVGQLETAISDAAYESGKGITVTQKTDDQKGSIAVNAGKGLGFDEQDGNKLMVNTGDGLTVDSSNKVTVKYDDTNLTMTDGALDLKDDLNVTSVTAGNGFKVNDTVELTSSGLTVGSNTSLTADTLTVGGKAYITSTGLNANGVISGVGTATKNDEAVNLEQMKTAISDAAYESGKGITVTQKTDDQKGSIAVNAGKGLGFDEQDGNKLMVNTGDGLTVDSSNKVTVKYDDTNLTMTNGALDLKDSLTVTDVNANAFNGATGSFSASVTVGDASTGIRINNGTISGLVTANIENESDAVSVGYLENSVKNNASGGTTYDDGDGITITPGAEGNNPSISVKYDDTNLTMTDSALDLKDDLNVTSVTAGNGFKVNETTKLTSAGLTVG
ncbi:ESPR domain-containing protein, partial [Megasphaera sp. An286]|uniref:ESPR domain-containing protein n=1 Tax=Megasphaera sp. An286 TaxID=1965622 RepID=UPI000B554499